MNTTEYKSIIAKELREYADLIHRQYEIGAEMERKLQLIRATINMLPDAEQAVFVEKVRELATSIEAEGLSAAVRRILQESRGDWHTATNVRDKLVSCGFDFSNYTSNPLSSIHAILKRLKPPEVEMTNLEGGVMAWRWRTVATEVDPDFPHRRRLIKKQKSYGATNSLANTVLRKA